MKINRFGFIFIICVNFIGCAYHLGTGTRTLPGGYRQVAVPIFKNRTHEVGSEVDFTNALIREFEQSKIVDVISPEMAPIQIEGTIESIRYTPRATAQKKEIPALPENAILNTSYQVIAKVRLKVIRSSDSSVIWDGTVINEKSYSAPQVGTPVVNSSNVLYNQSARRTTLHLLAKDLMREAHDRMTENF